MSRSVLRGDRLRVLSVVAVAVMAATIFGPGRIAVSAADDAERAYIAYLYRLAQNHAYRLGNQDRRIKVFEAHSPQLVRFLARDQTYDVVGATLSPTSSTNVFRSTLGDGGLQNTTGYSGGAGAPPPPTAGYATVLNVPESARMKSMRVDYQDPNGPGTQDDGTLEFFLTRYTQDGTAEQLLPGGSRSSNDGKQSKTFPIGGAGAVVASESRYVFRVAIDDAADPGEAPSSDASRAGNRFFGATIVYAQEGVPQPPPATPPPGRRTPLGPKPAGIGG